MGHATDTIQTPTHPQEPSPKTVRSEERMNLRKTYTALLTADLAAAEGWYTKLLGRGPDHRPMDTLVQWELFR